MSTDALQQEVEEKEIIVEEAEEQGQETEVKVSEETSEQPEQEQDKPVSYTHLRAHET